MIAFIALALVVAAGVFLVTLGAAFLLTPSKASEFLLGFAGSPAKHYAELAVRFLVGGALLLHAPQMLIPRVFSVAGWIILVTTAGLLLIPWRWHRRFAQRSVPEALRFLPLLGISSAAIGVLVLVAVFRSSAA